MSSRPASFPRLAPALALAVVTACGGGGAKPPTTAGTGSAGSAGSAATRPAPPRDPKLVRVDEALARIPALKTALADLRKLPFKQDVPARYQTTEEFGAFVSAEVAATFTPDKSEAIATAMHHIGLLREKIDLAKTLGDAFVSQAAAYYDPKQKKFFVVIVPEDNLSLDAMSVHELTHALQDQHFDLDPYLETEPALDDDQANARKFVVEGEATLTMMAYAAGAQMRQQAPDTAVDMLGAQRPLLKVGLAMAAGMSLEQLTAQLKQQQAGAAGVDPSIQQSIDAMDQIPPIILVPMFDSYMKGALAVLAAYDAGGWDEVGALYANPPQSTEQMLHPYEKLYPTRDVPTAVTLPALPGIEPVFGNVIGELGFRVFFSLWPRSAGETKKAPGDQVAAGWDGDRYVVGKTADGGLVGILATAWDSASEAKEFARAYEAAAKVRFPNKERKVWVKVKGTKVFVVDGGTDAKLIDAVVKGTRFE